MNVLMKNMGKQGLVIFILAFLTIFLYGFIHEFSHYTACKVIGLEGKIEINLLVDPPIYSMNCEGINEKPIFSKFLFWGSPYFISLIIMILFFFYLNKKVFYLLGLPLGIVLNDAMNIFGLYEWTYKTGQAGNDLLNILFKTNNLFYIAIFIVLGLTGCFFILTMFKFYKEFAKSLKTPNINK